MSRPKEEVAMIRLSRVVLGIVVGALWTASASAQQIADFQAPTQPECVPGELLVKFRGGAAAPNAMQQVAGQRVLRFDFIGVDLVRVSPDRALPEAISTLNATGAVEYAECNYRQYAV